MSMVKPHQERKHRGTKRKWPKIEDTEFGKERLVSQAVQRSYNQSGLEGEALSEEDETQ